MKHKLLLSFALAFVLAAAVGCKDSKKAAQSEATTVPKPTQPPAAIASAKPKVVASKPQPAPPPLDTMVLAETFRVKPPASFGSDQISSGTAVEFLVAGGAGQFLVVDTGEIYRVSVRAAHNGSRKLSLGDDSKGRWFYALPEAGTYQVLYAPIGTPAIKFSWLNINDPLTDPGIKPDQISIEFGSFAQKNDLRVTPYVLNDDEDYWESWPTHLAVESSDFEFRIMAVAYYEKLFEKDKRMTALQSSLRAKGKNADVRQLPYPEYKYGGLNLWAQPELLEGDGWRGLRWIAGFAQDISCAWEMGGQTLAYYFEGISNDGRFFILVRARVSNSALFQRFGEDCAAAESEVRNPNLNAVFQKDVIGAKPSSFEPNFNQLDAVIRSLKLQR
jgi:hypothetical protein